MSHERIIKDVLTQLKSTKIHKHQNHFDIGKHNPHLKPTSYEAADRIADARTSKIFKKAGKR